MAGWKLLCRPHREGKYCHFLKFPYACGYVQILEKYTLFPMCGLQRQVHTVPQVPVSHQSKSLCISGLDHWSFRQPQAITYIHRLKHAIVVEEGSGRKPLGMLTGSLILTRKVPHGKLMTSLKLLKPKRPKGLQTHSPGRQESCQLFHPGWAG